MDYQNGATMKEIVEMAMQEKRMSIARLAEATDIPERYVAMLVSGDYKSLPPAPYVRGYIMRLAGALGLDGQELWQLYKRHQQLRTSGEGDKLPSNRFALKRMDTKKAAAIAIAVALIVGIGMKIISMTGAAEIDIKNPIQNNVVTNQQVIDLQGKITPGDRLKINNEEIVIDKNGYFEKNFSLEPGINSIEFKVKRLLGKEVTVVKTIIYQQ